jgi:hypothetical protein
MESGMTTNRIPGEMTAPFSSEEAVGFAQAPATKTFVCRLFLSLEAELQASAVVA